MGKGEDSEKKRKKKKDVSSQLDEGTQQRSQPLQVLGPHVFHYVSCMLPALLGLAHSGTASSELS